ncbi:hypothetical protein JHV675_54040 [Mycobacterium avium subsp. hominissuis]
MRARLLAEGVDAATAESAAPPRPSGRQPAVRAATMSRAEHTTRLIVAALTAG